MKAQSPFDQKWYYFVDKCLPFGHSMSCAIFQKISDGIAAIVEHITKALNINYLDDFFFAAILRYYCNQQLDTFLTVCKSICFPVSLDKTFWATDRLTFLGLLIDTYLQRVCIPREKIAKLVEIIETVLNKKSKKVTSNQLQVICGHLNFVCTAVVPGRAFTRRLYMLTKGLTHPNHHRHMTKDMRLDLEMWLKFLQSPEAYSRPFLDFTVTTTAREIDFYTDASRNPHLGVGGICQESWFIKRWDSDFILRYNPSIAYLELYGVTVGILNWLSRFQNQRIVLFCDNLSVVHMINTNTSSCPQCLKLVRVIVMESMLQNCRVFAKHVSTKANYLADCLSRLKLVSFLKRGRGRFEKHPTPIPDQLWPMTRLWLGV